MEYQYQATTQGHDEKAAQTRKKNAESQKQYRERKKAQEQATQQKVAELERENYALKNRLNTLNQVLSMSRGKYPTDPQPGFTEDNWLHELQQSVSTGTGTYHLNTTGHYCHSNELGFDSDSGLPIPITPSHSITGSPTGSWADAALIGRNLQPAFNF